MLAVITGNGSIAIDEAADFRLVLPRVEEFADLDLTGPRKAELDRVEKGR